MKQSFLIYHLRLRHLRLQNQRQNQTASGSTRGTLPAGFKSESPKPAEAPKPEAAKPRPAASGPTHGTLPAGFKPAEAPKPAESPKPESSQQSSYNEPNLGEVAPAYAQISSTGYTGNKYFATRKRLSYHPMDKQFTGSPTTTQTTTTAPPPAPEPEHDEPKTQRGTLPAGMKPQEKKSMWKAKGSEVAETYAAEETHHAPPPPPKPAASGPTHGTLPAGFKSESPKPAEAPKPEAKTKQDQLHQVQLMVHYLQDSNQQKSKATESPKPESSQQSSYNEPSSGEVAPAYAQIHSTGYTGNKYFATRKRLSYHPMDKQFTGSSTTTTTAPPAPEPPKPKSTIRTTLPAGFKP